MLTFALKFTSHYVSFSLSLSWLMSLSNKCFYFLTLHSTWSVRSLRDTRRGPSTGSLPCRFMWSLIINHYIAIIDFLNKKNKNFFMDFTGHLPHNCSFTSKMWTFLTFRAWCLCMQRRRSLIQGLGRILERTQGKKLCWKLQRFYWNSYIKHPMGKIRNPWGRILFILKGWYWIGFPERSTHDTETQISRQVWRLPASDRKSILSFYLKI